MTRKRQTGLTLIEVGVALCVAGLMLAVAIPALSAVTRAQLRQKTGQLAGGLRALYGAAAIAGHTCRLVFDLDDGAYWSECSKSNVRISREGERSQNGARSGRAGSPRKRPSTSRRVTTSSRCSSRRSPAR